MLTPPSRMTPTAFQQWCRALQLAPATCDFLASKRASAELHPTYIDNLLFLEDYL